MYNIVLLYCFCGGSGAIASLPQAIEDSYVAT